MSQVVRWGIIGCGLMGREFAGAVARWCQLIDAGARPEIVAVCSRTEQAMRWFTSHFPTVRQATASWRELLRNPDVDAVYIALPHHLHAEVYCAAVAAGKHLMGEKPFGIDLAANAAILAEARAHPRVFVRCTSQFPFFPAAQQIGRMIDAGTLGRILEVETGFLHSSDLDPDKPWNWKRSIEFNGRYGVLGDLGMHACHVPFRAGWRPKNVRAILSNIFDRRPDGRGGTAPCDTWDNATLLIEAVDPATGESFPWTLKTQRIAPGQQNTWYVEIGGTKSSVRFSTRDPKRYRRLDYTGGPQVWGEIECGCQTAFPTTTGGIFEFGFGDAMLQMWAAFHRELAGGDLPGKFAGCATPEEVALSHRLFTAALASQETSSTVAVDVDVD
jgi:predicted dehydrogenase